MDPAPESHNPAGDGGRKNGEPLSPDWMDEEVFERVQQDEGLLLLGCAVRNHSLREQLTAHRQSLAILTMIVLCVWGCGDGLAGQISVSGQLHWSFQGESREREETNAFTAMFDQDGLLVTYSLPPLSLSPRYGIPPTSNSNVVFLSKQHYALAIMSPHKEMVTASLRRAELPWILGNCGGNLESRVFLAVRCLELFPEESSSKSRRLATTYAVAGTPMSLISQATWTYSATAGEPGALTCEVRVDDRLRRAWRSDELLRIGFPDSGERFRRAQAQLASYSHGFLLERMQFSMFTNVGGVRFPMRADFWKYKTPGKIQPGEAEEEALYERGVLEFRDMNYSATTEVAFPGIVSSNEFSVTETRLSDRSLGIDGVRYSTNALTSLEISPLAVAEFERVAEPARRKRFLVRLLRVSTVVMLATLCLGAFWLIFKHRRHIVPYRPRDAS
jgi:hypothetical protein